jgi:hypothetical protein
MVEVGSAETLPLGIDFAAYLEGAETVNGSGGPTATLVDLTDGSSTAGVLSGSPSVSGTKVLQTVTVLKPGHRYRLDVLIRPAAGKVWEASLEVDCPY